MKCNFTREKYEKLIRDCGFTDDELKVFALKQRGWYGADIAAEMNISLRTVSRLYSSIKSKIAEVSSVE